MSHADVRLATTTGSSYAHSLQTPMDEDDYRRICSTFRDVISGLANRSRDLMGGQGGGRTSILSHGGKDAWKIERGFSLCGARTTQGRRDKGSTDMRLEPEAVSGTARKRRGTSQNA